MVRRAVRPQHVHSRYVQGREGLTYLSPFGRLILCLQIPLGVEVKMSPKHLRMKPQQAWKWGIGPQRRRVVSFRSESDAEMGAAPEASTEALTGLVVESQFR